MTKKDWLAPEEKRSNALGKSGKKVNNPSALNPPRKFKGFRVREDYIQRFDLIVTKAKHSSSKNGPDLIEEALEMLFKKHE